MLAKRHNIDLSAFFDGVRNSAGNSYVFETEVPLIYNGTYDPGFTIDLHCKVKVIYVLIQKLLSLTILHMGRSTLE